MVPSSKANAHTPGLIVGRVLARIATPSQLVSIMVKY
jgi:hypothetical protein